MREMTTPEELFETQGGSPIGSAEAPGPGTVLEDQIPKGARPFPPLPKRSCNNGGSSAEEATGPGAEPIRGPSLVTRDWRDEPVGTTDLQQGRDPGAVSPEPGKDHAAQGPGRTEAGRRVSSAAEAAIVVLGE